METNENGGKKNKTKKPKKNQKTKKQNNKKTKTKQVCETVQLLIKKNTLWLQNTNSRLDIHGLIKLEQFLSFTLTVLF